MQKRFFNQMNGSAEQQVGKGQHCITSGFIHVKKFLWNFFSHLIKEQ